MASTSHFTLIQQNDTHAQMELHWEHFWRNGRPEYRRVGGYARAATIAAEIRRETAGAAILVDCGDAIHGTAPAQWTEGAAVVPVLNAMGVDLMTPGNWEFGFGPEVLQTRIAEMGFPVIACNVENAATGKDEFQSSALRDIGGVRVGFVGVTSTIVTDTMPSQFGAGLRFGDEVAATRQAIATMRREQSPDLIVVVSHIGFPQEAKLAREIEGIGVVLSSHTHNRLAVPYRVGETLIIQSGFSGSFLGRLDLEVGDGHIRDYSHQLVAVQESVEEDPETAAIVERQMAPFRERMAEKVGTTATALDRMTVLESTMDNVITDAYLELAGAEVAFSHGWRYGVPIPPGDVTMGDLWQMIPTNPEVFTVTMSGHDIHRLLEASLESVFAPDPFQQKGGYVIRTSGLNAVVRLNNPRGMRIEHLDIAGSAFDADRRYRVAAAGEQDLREFEDRQNTGVRAIEAIRGYFQRRSAVRADLTHTKFIAV